ncbi:MAG: hypothetical protein HKN13_07400 [Rhodothermales bacterium]|nr:hypothetical protein [Rhodothermales bacterium]
MGRAILVLVAASLLGLVSIAYVGQQTRVATEETTADYGYKVIARDIAHSGLDKALSNARVDLMSGQKTWTDVSMGGGSYDVNVVDNMYGDMTINVDAKADDAVHSVQTNVLFEAPMPAAVVLSGEDIVASATGNTFQISGVDRRAPSVASGNGFLAPIYGVMANTPDVANEVLSSMSADNIVGQGGVASVSNGIDMGWYHDLYTSAMSSASLITPSAPYSGVYGSTSDPKVVLINGDFVPTGSFSGAGLLIVGDGDVNILDSFSWEGLVVIRRADVADISIDLGGNTVIHGGLVAMEATGAVSTSTCTDVPFTIDGLQTIPQVPFAVRFDVLGAAISAGGSYDMPVTSTVRIGDDTTAPWGDYGNPIDANLNTGIVYDFEPEGTFAPGTGVTVSGRSWVKNFEQDGDLPSEWSVEMEQNSESGGSQLTVLRNGDNVPDLAGYLDQTSAEEFVSGFIGDDGKMKLAENQSIYLFELGTSDPSSAAWDMQDLVVVVTLVRADAGCETTAAAAGSISFSMSGSAQINYSGEAIAKLGAVLPSVQMASKVVIASQKEKASSE